MDWKQRLQLVGSELRASVCVRASCGSVGSNGRLKGWGLDKETEMRGGE